MTNKRLMVVIFLLVPALALCGAWYPANPRTGDMQTDAGGTVRAQNVNVAHFRWASPDALDADVIRDVTPTTGSPRIISTTFTQPDVCRNLTVKAPTSYNGVVTVTGTNIAGNVIHEAFTLSTTGTTVGVLAFKTVTKVTVPANEQVQVGTGDKLGLPYMSAFTCVLDAYLNNTRESTAATVVRDADEIEKNTLDLNSSLNNQVVDVFFTWY
jgi:hypothetical protein